MKALVSEWKNIVDPMPQVVVSRLNRPSIDRKQSLVADTGSFGQSQWFLLPSGRFRLATTFPSGARDHMSSHLLPSHIGSLEPFEEVPNSPPCLAWCIYFQGFNTSLQRDSLDPRSYLLTRLQRPVLTSSSYNKPNPAALKYV